MRRRSLKEKDSQEPRDTSRPADVDATAKQTPTPQSTVATNEEVPLKGDAAAVAALSSAGKKAKGAAHGMSHSILSGFGAIKDVHEASRRHANAVADLKSLSEGLKEDKRALAHREDVERTYPQVVQTQTTEIAAAKEALADASKREESLTAERDKIAADLVRLKADNETKLRPYRNLMESSRGRADDAARTLANAKRSLKAAEDQVADATKRRSMRIQAANQAVDSASERLRKVQDDLKTLSADPGAPKGAIERTKGEIAAETSHLATAKAEVISATQESQTAVDQAQAALWAEQKTVQEAERASETARIEANSRKSEYDALAKRAQAQEKELDDARKAREATIKEVHKQEEAAKKRITQAQAILDDAHDIHDHPAATQGLRERITNEETDVAQKQQEVKALASEIAHLKKTTRLSRFSFVIVTIIVIAVVIALLWYFFIR